MYLLLPTEFDPNVRAPGVGPNSIDIIWSNRGIGRVQRVLITAQYSGPCSDVTVPNVTAMLEDPASNLYEIRNLEEFSTYRINVTILSSRGIGSDVIMAETTGTG